MVKLGDKIRVTGEHSRPDAWGDMVEFGGIEVGGVYTVEGIDPDGDYIVSGDGLRLKNTAYIYHATPFEIVEE